MVAISSRRLPAGSVFSLALRPVVTAPATPIGGSFTGLPGTMPASMPVAAYGITSGFGMRQHPILGVWRSHAGLDLAASYGSPIVATSDGMVSTAGWQGGYGLLVTLDHGGGLQTRYGHMSRLNVEPGQQVRKGSVIGYVGSSGLATGPHLHYEIRLNGQPINPTTHLNGR
ncbi:M23 family metallopeptidase [Novosphingobium sp. G106]|nr:M23 family metallopeptidase [Novosphingobium sp. G106]